MGVDTPFDPDGLLVLVSIRVFTPRRPANGCPLCFATLVFAALVAKRADLVNMIHVRICKQLRPGLSIYKITSSRRLSAVIFVCQWLDQAPSPWQEVNF